MTFRKRATSLTDLVAMISRQWRRVMFDPGNIDHVYEISVFRYVMHIISVDASATVHIGKQPLKSMISARKT